MKFQMISLKEMEDKMHEEREARYTKMREGEFSGEMPGAYGNVGGGMYDESRKKVADPIEGAEVLHFNCGGAVKK